MSETNPKNWPLWILVALMVFGVGAGIYMTQHHEIQLYGDASMQGALLGCVESEKVSCDLVNTSEWSELAGIPLFTLAVPVYLWIMGLAIAVTRGRRELLWLIVGTGVLTSLHAIFLGYISVVELGKVCTWCMRLYAVNFATPILAILAGALAAEKPTTAHIGRPAAVFFALLLASVGVQKAYRSTLLEGTPEIAAALPAVAEPSKADNSGPAPALSWEVTTEDGNPATLAIHPDDAWKGPADATVAVVEFGDLECGYCKRAAGQLSRLYDAYGDRVAFVFKHYPLDPGCNPGVKNRKHRYACVAAEASVCAQEQGAFWAFHDLAYKNQHALDPESLVQYAVAAGVDKAEFEGCLRSGRAKAVVQADGAHGKEMETHGTPRIWINGKLYRSGSSAEQMAREIELALGTDAASANAKAREMRNSGNRVTPIPADVPDMVNVQGPNGAFKIDTFEAGLADSAATVGKHQVPAIRMSWFAARDACEAAGKRMCTEAEWLSACQGAPAIDDDKDGAFADDMVEGTTYPYDDLHQPGRCWDGRPPTGFRPVYTGEMPGCVTKDGAYDMAGNVEEWVGDSPENAVLLGGAYDTTKDKARCYRRNDVYGAGYANRRTGFRCCANP